MFPLDTVLTFFPVMVAIFDFWLINKKKNITLVKDHPRHITS